jgi:hypothetical protein
MAANSSVRPVSPEKKSFRCAEVITHDDQSVVLRVVGVRPEKCCAGVARNDSAPPGSTCSSHQSSSTTSRGSTPYASRCAPTPSDVMTGTRRRASSSMLARQRWS